MKVLTHLFTLLFLVAFCLNASIQAQKNNQISNNSLTNSEQNAIKSTIHPKIKNDKLVFVESKSINLDVPSPCPENLTENFVASGTVIFDTDALTYGGVPGGFIEGNNAVFQFNSIEIPAGTVVRGIGSRPLILRSNTDIDIAGTVHVNGSNATPTAPSCQAFTLSPGGAGGGGGGSGVVGPGLGLPGGGLGGGQPGGQTHPNGAGGAGYGGNGGSGGGSNAGASGSSYGDLALSLQGGSGGGGASTNSSSCQGASGGGGGGALMLFANNNINILSTGRVLANGGNGAISDVGASGAGSGGGIVLRGCLVNNAGIVQAIGGNGGEGGCCGGGGGGGGGRVLIYNINVITGTVSVTGGLGGTGGGNGQNGSTGSAISTTIACTCPCPKLITAPPNVSIMNSTCGSNCTKSGGIIIAPGSNTSINGVPSNPPCPVGSTIQYNVNGTGWTSIQPTYAQDGPVQSISTRCNCNENPDMSSPPSTPVTTAPGACPQSCSLVSTNVGNCASTVNKTTTSTTVTSDNCQINFPYTSDAHAFAQTTLCGDGSITTLVNQASMSSNALAGLIMRETTMAGAKKTQLTINKAGMSSSSFRDVNNASATFLANAHINHFWLRITRTGNVFSTFVSLDGTTWKPVGTKTIPMASCINMGLIVHTSNVQMMIPPSTQGTASFSNTSTTGSGSAPVRPNNIGTNFDQLAIADFKISPNPTYGLTDIDLSAYSKTQVQLDIMSLQGKLLRTTVIEAGAEREQMDLSGFSSGMYLIRARAEGLPDVTKRLVVGTTP
jgi:regulation of enolase protein 1 (concanavalin A-like superfamily)